VAIRGSGDVGREWYTLVIMTFMPLPWHLLEISFRKEMPRIELK